MKKLLLILTLFLLNNLEAKIIFAEPYSLLQSISEIQKIDKLINYIEKSEALFSLPSKTI
jgi:hypothetical protein